MSETILKIENISKQYRLGLVGKGTLSDDLKRWWYRVRGKEDPFLKIGEVNDRSTVGNSDYVWALKDINIEVKQGEVLGIIGKNGAGKSTLLKILSKVTGPTTGTIKSKGRIASLLEVGTGFHGEMTGRENIYLNGAILGMNKAEITNKIDEIIEFSGCERYIDTPVKRYSSGMTVRLAFAVAAFLEPDILVIDEVLAVGDAEFQKKAIGKMQDISRGDGRTVLFVSHNMAAVENLCTRVVVLKNGRISYSGKVGESIQEYLKSNTRINKLEETTDRKGNGKVKLLDFSIFGDNKKMNPQTGKSFNMEFILENNRKTDSSRIRFDLRIDDNMGQRIIWLSDSIVNDSIVNTENLKIITFCMKKLNLNKGLYYVTTHILVDNEVSDWIQNAFSFEVTEGDYYNSSRLVPINQSKLLVDFNVKYS
ncbi:MAG: lipopolysaccharide transport system ATP-binding protein [Planctomycetota bacterium]